MSGGTPPTTPRFGAPRYSDATDPAAFAADVNAISDAFDHAVKLTQTVKTGAYTAVDGDAVIVGSGAASAVTITLPAHAANQIVSVANFSTFGTTVAGTSIQGKGLNNASSFPLGTVGAKALLFDDGTHWYLLAGEQDSGWLALTLTSNISSVGGYTAAVRVRGDMAEMCGEINDAFGSISVPATVPAIAIPAQRQFIRDYVPAGGGADPNFVYVEAGTGAVTFTGPIGAGKDYFFDGSVYRLS